MRSVSFRASPPRRARVLDIPEACYEFAVLTDLHYRKPKGGCRKAIGTIQAHLTADTLGCEILLTDVSRSGIGFIGMDRFCESEEVAVRFEIPNRTLRLCGEIRHSLPVRSVPEIFRTGLRFKAMDRVHNAVWTSFLESLR